MFGVVDGGDDEEDEDEEDEEEEEDISFRWPVVVVTV